MTEYIRLAGWPWLWSSYEAQTYSNVFILLRLANVILAGWLQLLLSHSGKLG